MFSYSKKGGNKTKRHELFHSRVAQLGCIISGDPNVQIHHIYGAKANRKSPEWGKVHIGEFAILPLHPLHHHQQYEREARAIGWGNLHGNKRDFEKKYGTEIELFAKMIQLYGMKYNDDILCQTALELILQDY